MTQSNGFATLSKDGELRSAAAHRLKLAVGLVETQSNIIVTRALVSNEKLVIEKLKDPAHHAELGEEFVGMTDDETEQEVRRRQVSLTGGNRSLRDLAADR